MAMLREKTALVWGARWIGLGCLLVVSGCHSQPFGDSRNHAEEEATLRRLDADWVKAAKSRQVDAWMAFYAADAVVLPPNEKLAVSRDDIRTSVAGLLGLPGLSLTWQPVKVEVAQSRELAYLYGAYELTANDPHGKPTKDYGKNVEIWKKQPNGSWKCILDTWNSDLPAAPLIPVESGPAGEASTGPLGSP